MRRVSSLSFLEHPPSAVAYSVRPDADVLILGSGGGTEALTALANKPTDMGEEFWSYSFRRRVESE